MASKGGYGPKFDETIDPSLWQPMDRDGVVQSATSNNAPLSSVPAYDPTVSDANVNSLVKLAAQERKNHPMATGVLDYFPDALYEVAELSKIGNDQHNPGQPLHWAKEKSTDHADALLRHLKDRGTRDTDGVRHWTKVAWRALAGLQTAIEAERKGEAQKEWAQAVTKQGPIAFVIDPYYEH